MDTLKKLFPFSFKKKKALADLIVNILLYLIAMVVVGALVGVLGIIPLKLINWVTGTAGGVIGLYLLVGAILSVLDYMKVLK